MDAETTFVTRIWMKLDPQDHISTAIEVQLFIRKKKGSKCYRYSLVSMHKRPSNINITIKEQNNSQNT